MRYFIYLQYDGTEYHGWQTQPGAVTVQETIEQKLSMLLRCETKIMGAGRTDAGVHARLMVAHFDYPNSQSSYENDNENENSQSSYENDNENEKASYENENSQSSYENDNQNEKVSLDLEDLTFKLGQVLPPDIKILKIVPVKEKAHARFSALSRTYKYYITNSKPLYNRNYVSRVYDKSLDVELMNHACAKLFCYEDFSSFCKSHTDTKTNICKIMDAYWTSEPNPDGVGDLYIFTIHADRFLRNMVRAVVGTLLQVGRHQMTIQDFAKVIEGKNRCIAGESVPACGLFLVDIEYPEDIFDPSSVPPRGED